MLCYAHFVPADLDFSPAPIELSISPGSEVLDLVLHIQVIDDDIAEREEVFWVHLNCSTSDPLDKDELVIVQQSLLVRIMPDGRDGKHEFSLIRVQYNSTEIIMATMDNLSYYLHFLGLPPGRGSHKMRRHTHTYHSENLTIIPDSVCSIYRISVMMLGPHLILSCSRAYFSRNEAQHIINRSLDI